MCSVLAKCLYNILAIYMNGSTSNFHRILSMNKLHTFNMHKIAYFLEWDSRDIKQNILPIPYATNKVLKNQCWDLRVLCSLFCHRLPEHFIF